MTTTKSLYKHPKVYWKLLEPSFEMNRMVIQLCRKYTFQESFQRVVDPACGPGNWLKPFSNIGKKVAGNDIVEEMISFAKQQFKPHLSEFTVGDMRELHFSEPLFDVAVNFDGSLGHLQSDEDILLHLDSLASCVRCGGIYLIGIMFQNEAISGLKDVQLYESDWESIDSHQRARAFYQMKSYSAKERKEWIQVEVQIHEGEEEKEHWTETYPLHTFTYTQWEALLQKQSKWTEVAIHSTLQELYPLYCPSTESEDVLIVLKKN